MILGISFVWNVFNCSFSTIIATDKIEYVIWYDDFANSCRNYKVIYTRTYDRK